MRTAPALLAAALAVTVGVGATPDARPEPAPCTPPGPTAAEVDRIRAVTASGRDVWGEHKEPTAF